jgi:LemA protein
MIGMLLIGIVVLCLVGMIIVGYLVGMYNSLILLKNDIEKAWSNIDVLLKQRNDELPNLIETVKGYMKHEKTVLEDVTKARTAVMSAQTMPEKAQANNMMTGALKTLFAVSENYPQLRANENFLQLQGRITGLENEIADRREFFNNAVMLLNTRIESFPDMFVAGMLKLQKREMFKATEAERQVVKVSF